MSHISLSRLLGADENAPVFNRFQHLSDYITSRSQQFDWREVMEPSGYRNLNSFREHRKEFDACGRNIPLGYLKAIGADFETIGDCLEADRKRFQAVLNEGVQFHGFSARYQPWAVLRHDFSEPLRPRTAVDTVRQLMEERPAKCLLEIPGVVVIHLEPRQPERVWVSPPAVRYTKTHLAFRINGAMVGVKEMTLYSLG